MSLAINSDALPDDAIFSKQEKPDGTLVALTWAPVVMGIFILPQCSNPIEATITVVAAGLMKWCAKIALWRSKAMGYRTITLREDSIIIDNKGVEKVYPLDSISSVLRKRSKYTGAVECDILFEYRIKTEAGEKIRFQTNDPLPHLMKTVGRRLAKDLEVKLMSEGIVDWVPGVVIQHDGIKLPVSGMLTRKRPLKWEQLREIQFRLEQALVYIHGKKSPASRINTNHVDFFPGLFLVEKLLEQARKPGEVRVQISEPV